MNITVSDVGNLLTGLGTIGLLFVASQGLDAWRQQLVGKEEYEVAREIINALMGINGFLWKTSQLWRTHDEEVASEKTEEEFHVVINILNEASSGAVLHWGRDWAQKDELEGYAKALMEVGFNMGNCNANPDNRKRLIDELGKRTDRIIDKLREVALGKRMVQ